MSPVRLSVVIGHKALMRQLGSLPTRDLLEMHLTHPSHHINYVELTHSAYYSLPDKPSIRNMIVSLRRFCEVSSTVNAISIARWILSISSNLSEILSTRLLASLACWKNNAAATSGMRPATEVINPTAVFTVNTANIPPIITRNPNIAAIKLNSDHCFACSLPCS